ncbi:MAG: glycine cleavage system protein GcvH [Firmicutes bacterium]|nr:glycine cleavage system protein GcvH [Bacillota bacterium]
MGFKFTKNHEWVKIEEGTAYIGISDYAQQHLSDIVFVDLPKVGVKLTAGKVFASVESVKAVSDVYAPIGGTVIEISEALENAPELLNENALENWLVKIEPADIAEADALMDEDAYTVFCQHAE